MVQVPVPVLDLKGKHILWVGVVQVEVQVQERLRRTEE